MFACGHPLASYHWDTCRSFSERDHLACFPHFVAFWSHVNEDTLRKHGWEIREKAMEVEMLGKSSNYIVNVPAKK